MRSLSSIGALAWLLAAFSPVSIDGSDPSDTFRDVVTTDHSVATSPTHAPEAARARGDAGSTDAHGHLVATLARDVDADLLDRCAGEAAHVRAHATRPCTRVYAPRTSRGPPSP